jgi:radical SAM superfamily enzyme YgiQ (UPF0313 family)
VDDNFFGTTKKHADWAKELLRAIIKRGKKRHWFSQTSVNMGSDLEGVKLAKKAGCCGMLVGLETFNPANLKTYSKGLNTKLLEKYRTLVDGFHKGGLAVFGCFIMGADEDTEDVVADTTLKSMQIGVDILQITNLTPLPGTKLYDRWMEEGRIHATNYPEDWERYSFVETVFNPAKISTRRLDEVICEMYQAAATEPWVWTRTLKSFLRTRSLSTAIFVHQTNIGFKKLAISQANLNIERLGFKPTDNERTQKLRKACSLFCGKPK